MRLVDLLQCPYDGTFPLDLQVVAQEKVRNNLRIDKVFCRQYCAYKNGLIRSFMPVLGDCQECFANEIIQALLICPSCKRWFPVLEGIPSIMPDELRSSREGEFLEAFPSIIRCGSVRIAFPKVSDLTKEVKDKRKEMERRDCEAPIYEHVFTHYKTARERDAVFERLAFHEEDILLDIGCGTGRLTRDYASRVNESITTDFSLESLKILQKSISRQSSRPVHPIQLDACLLPFNNSSFTKILSTQVYEHVPSKASRLRAYKEVNRMMKRGGVFVLTIYLYNLHKRLYHCFKPGRFSDTAKSGYHCNGQIYYYNFSFGEARRELSSIFKMEEITGIINNIPLITRLLGNQRGKVDRFLENTHLSHILGTFILGKCRKRECTI